MARYPRIVADANGSPFQPTGRDFLVVETCIDLDGNSHPERLVADDRTLFLSNGCPGGERRWRLDEIDGFRVQPAIGSCFVQARTGGQWIDLLRRPGGSDPQLAESLARLNALSRIGRSGEGSDPPLAAKPQTAARRNDEHRPQADANSQPRRMASQLSSLLRPFRGSVLLLLALSAAAVGVEVVPPLLQGMLVDRVLTTDAAHRPSAQLLLLLLAIVMGLLLVRLAGSVVGIWKGCVSSRVGASMTADLRNALVEKLNALPLAFHDRNQVGVLMSQVAYDTETLHTLIYHMTSGLLLQSLQLTGISAVLFYLNPKLAAITLLPMPLILAGSWYFTRYLQPRQHHYWEAVGKQASALMGMLSGMRVVKAFVQEGREIRRFRQSSRRLRDSRLTVDISTSTFTAAMGMLFAVGGLAVWYVGGRNVLFGRMTLGSLMAFLAYLAMFYAPLTSIAESTAWFANFFGTSRRICDVLAVPDETETPRSAVSLERIRGRVELQGVSFGYDKSRPVLKDIELRDPSGRNDRRGGAKRLGQVDAGQPHRPALRRRRGTAPHRRRRCAANQPTGPATTDRHGPARPISLPRNHCRKHRLRQCRAAPEKILLAAKQADAHDFIMETPLAYSTQLREGGSGLSGGERQRLSIARALLFDPAILILDEATSSVDAESESAICNTIRRWTRQRTAIVISHRLSTLRGADRLLVFDQGRLIEQGTHEELVAQGGIYSTLASVQGNAAEIRRRLQAPVGGGAISSIEPAIGEDFLGSATQDSRGASTASENDNIHWLDPDAAAVKNNQQGELRLISPAETVGGVYAVRAFLAEYERQYVSLRHRNESGRSHEVGMIDRLARWPRSAQEAINRSLGRRYLLRRILEIRQIRTSENVLSLSVETDGGPAAIRLTKPGEGSQPFGPSGLLLTDAMGNCFVIPDRSAIPKMAATTADPLLWRVTTRIDPPALLLQPGGIVDGTGDARTAGSLVGAVGIPAAPRKGGRAIARASAPPDKAIGADPLSLEQLRDHARRLAHRQQPTGAASRLDCCGGSAKMPAHCRKAHRLLSRGSQQGRNVPESVVWLLDNYYLIEDEIPQPAEACLANTTRGCRG